MFELVLSVTVDAIPFHNNLIILRDSRAITQICMPFLWAQIHFSWRPVRAICSCQIKKNETDFFLAHPKDCSTHAESMRLLKAHFIRCWMVCVIQWNSKAYNFRANTLAWFWAPSMNARLKLERWIEEKTVNRYNGWMEMHSHRLKRAPYTQCWSVVKRK